MGISSLLGQKRLWGASKMTNLLRSTDLLRHLRQSISVALSEYFDEAKVAERSDRVIAYAQVLPFLITGSCVAALGVGFIMWRQGLASVGLLAWGIVFSVHAAYRFFNHRAFLRARVRGDLNIAHLERNHILSAALHGSLWGSFLAVVGDVPTDIKLFVCAVGFAFCALGGMVAGNNPLAFGLFVLCMTVPLILELTLLGGYYNTTLVAMILAAMVITYAIARKHYDSTLSQMRLKAENQEIAEKLEGMNRQLKVANEGKSRLIAAASHDLRQPVYGVTLMFNQMIEKCRQFNCKRTDICPQMRTEHEVRQIDMALSYLSQSLNNLLDLSRLEAGAIRVDISEISVGELFSRLNYEFAPHAIAKGVALRIRHSDMAIKADSSLLHSVLANLLANALTYTDRGGVLVAARSMDSGRICRLYVVDQGVGLSEPDIQSREIFREYHRASEEKNAISSAGLGLAIAERFANSMGSSINVRSSLGKGSMFWADFPAVKSVQKNPQASAIMLPGGAAMLGFSGLDAMLITSSVGNSSWIFQLLEENDALVCSGSSLIEGYMWAKRTTAGLLLVDLQTIRVIVPDENWMLISQIAAVSHGVLVVVIVRETEMVYPRHPFGISNCRVVTGEDLVPLKLKSILMRELRALQPRADDSVPKSIKDR